MKYSKLWIIVLCFTFLLAACTSSEQKIDLSKYPVGVQEGTITLDYFTILTDTNRKIGELHTDLEKLSADDMEGKKDLYGNFLTYINELNYSTSNDVEKEIDNYFSTFLKNAKHYAEYTIKYFDTESNEDLTASLDYMLIIENDMIEIAEIMDKYQLFTD